MRSFKLEWNPNRTLLRNFVIVGSAILVFIQVLALNPSTVEESRLGKSIHPQELLDLFEDQSKTLAPGIPKDRVPDYAIDHFYYISSHEDQKDWKLISDRAYLYQKDDLLHLANVNAEIYDEDGGITQVKGKEGKTYLNQKDFEVYGDVVTTFPDGFMLYSQYLKYSPGNGQINIPVSEPAQGEGQSSEGGKFKFTSHGLRFLKKQNHISLPADVVFETFPGESPPGSAAASKKDYTRIQSDTCEINRETQIALFDMRLNRPLAKRFVITQQPQLYVKSRTAELNYGESGNTIHYLTAKDDVFIKELDEDGSVVKTATCGFAEFLKKENQIVLTEYPQVYQDQDTVTGDKIIIYRDRDTVEVDQSNAYSQGGNEKEKTAKGKPKRDSRSRE